MRHPFILLIVNPKAGRYRKAALLHYEALLRRYDIRFEVQYSHMPGHGAVLASQAVEAGIVTHIFAAGGDGTLAEIAEPLTGSEIVLGIIPFGTANVLARELAIPFSVKKNAGFLVAAVRSGRRERIYPAFFETGMRKGLVLQMFGAGFDAFIVSKTSLGLKAMVGRVAYLYALMKAILFYVPQDYDVVIDGVVHSSVQSLIFSKGRYYAGHYRILPYSCQSHSHAMILLFSELRRAQLVRLGWALLWGRIAECKGVKTCLVQRKIMVQPSFGLPLQRDGDAVGEGGFSLHLVSKALCVIAGERYCPKL